MSSLALKAGAGKAAIGYPENFFPYRGFRGRRLLGVREDIYARVLLLENPDGQYLIISLELGDVTDEWAQEISQKTQVPADHIWLTVTHNHAAPYANNSWGEYIPDAEKTQPFCRCCVDAILRAVSDAKKTLRPARLRFGTGEAYVNVNRDVKYTGNQPEITSPYVMGKNPHGYSDRTVNVLSFSDETDHVFAYIVGYAVHSSALFQQFWDEKGGMEVCGDLSGAAMRYVEERSDAVAIHLLGAAGDQDARFMVDAHIQDRDGNLLSVDRSEGGVNMVEAMAEEWGSEVLLAAADAEEIPADVISAGTLTIHPKTKEKYDDGPPTSLPPGYEWKIGEEMDMPLFMLRIGSLALFGIPAELVARAGTRIRDTILSHGFARAMVVTQCNGSLSYLSDAEGYEKKTFEAVQSHFAPGVAESIQEGAGVLADRMLADTARP